jgi:hypothetical protein
MCGLVRLNQPPTNRPPPPKKKGIVSIEHADFDGIERLALVLGGEIASTFDNPKEVGVLAAQVEAGGAQRC